MIENVENSNKAQKPELGISDVSDSNRVQFLITLDEIHDINIINSEIKDIKYRILTAANNAVQLSGTRSSVKIERL
jgi:hypothetical protein